MNQSNAAQFEPESDDVFGRIASRYDLLCDLFSFFIHRIWKRRVAKILAEDDWTTLLDTAAGTGHIASAIAKKSGIDSNKQIVVSDISPKMLEIAKQRLRKIENEVELKVLNAESMPQIEAESFDAYSMSLGLKICDRQKALREAYRVLKPGGRLVVLEASNIPIAWLNALYLSYMKVCMPIIGWIATFGDSSAYQYLLDGIEGFPEAEKLAAEVSDLGFSNVQFERLSLGIVAIHTAIKPLAK